MNGADPIASVVVANSGPNWHAVETGDFDDDGQSDILLQNVNGGVAVWNMDGTNRTLPITRLLARLMSAQPRFARG
jgi:hypothetical protein